MKTISLITPTFNRSHTLLRLYHSIELQKYSNLEWIIVDDGSTDNTRALVDSVIKSSNIDIKYIYKTNGGKSSAVNLGLKHVSYEYVGIIDSDDEIFPGALKNLCCSITESPKNAVSFIGYCNSVNTKIPEGLYSWDELVKLNNFEMWGIHLSRFLKNIDFQPFKDEKFYPEYNVWSEINKDRNSYFTGHVLRIYHQDNLGLSKNILKLAYKNPKGYLQYFNKKYQSNISFLNRLKYMFLILIFKMLTCFS